MMKLTMLLFFAGFMQVSATVYSQATKFNFIAENKQVVDVLKEIEESSNFRFFYIREQVGVERQVTVKANGATVEQILDKLFDDQGISYKVMDDNLVLLSPDKSITTIEKLSSQQKSVSGKVTDESGQPLPGVTVLIKGTTNGSVTNIDGVFTISNIPENATLVFSFIGMRTQEVTVAGQTTINITMGVDAIGIEEVVAIGYGSQKKSDLTGAVVSVSNEDMNMGGTVSSAAQALQGRTAGVVVTQNSKAPGGSISVRIRGSNSISSNNEPLYVVDGFPTSNGSDINPNDIESMQILKDASATAIYGARGANGVILITTKRGKAGESEITYSGYVGTQKIVNPFDMLDGKQYMNLANALYKEIDGQENAENAVYTESQLQSNINTDWIKETSRTGVVQDHNIQFKGGSEKTKVLASLGYFDQKGVMKNTDFSRLSGRINIDQTVNDYVKAGATVFAQRENSNFQLYSGNILNQNVLLGILNYDPTVPAYNEDGTY
ncbi:MAG TPA: SusC/RagA family TonB-linked outer membrane protein, partial [Draconibacterium sp.]|nr:SusC/RagA family TonB-linked outer membrane protein [Draconibacterium sp.]